VDNFTFPPKFKSVLRVQSISSKHIFQSFFHLSVNSFYSPLCLFLSKHFLSKSIPHTSIFSVPFGTLFSKALYEILSTHFLSFRLTPFFFHHFHLTSPSLNSFPAFLSAQFLLLSQFSSFSSLSSGPSLLSVQVLLFSQFRSFSALSSVPSPL
jgi:hypothetical protein